MAKSTQRQAERERREMAIRLKVERLLHKQRGAIGKRSGYRKKIR